MTSETRPHPARPNIPRLRPPLLAKKRFASTGASASSRTFSQSVESELIRRSFTLAFYTSRARHRRLVPNRVRHTTYLQGSCSKMGRSPRHASRPLAESVFYSTHRFPAITVNTSRVRSTHLFHTTSRKPSEEVCLNECHFLDSIRPSARLTICPTTEPGRHREFTQAHELKPHCVESGRCGMNPHRFLTRTFEEDLSDDV